MNTKIDLRKEKEDLKRLVKVFSDNISFYKDRNTSFNEQMTRQQYIDGFLKLLGWDISNPMGLSYKEREVVAEEYSYVSNKDRPDYTIRMNGMSQFYIEAKKVSVDISTDLDAAIQTRRYGWNAGHKISALTNFEYMAIYLTYEMPIASDNVSNYRYKLYHYTEYVDKFDEIYQLLSRDSVVSGYFKDWTENTTPEDATKMSLDQVFLDQLNKWRIGITNDLINHDVNLDNYDNLNESIQTFLNQLVFLRFAEDNKFESTYALKEEIERHINYLSYFEFLDRKYNSELFKSSSIINDISEETLKEIVENLYFPNVSYDFSIIDLSILSKIYENFLQQEIVIEEGQAHLEKTKSAKIKSVISTPDEIVVAIVKQALDPIIKDKTVEEILDLKIADIAVGSGIFLIEAYNYLERHLVDLYAKEKDAFVDETIVPFSIKRHLIENVLWGYDINNQAVELTRFSLLLRLLSNESMERTEDISPILPSLTKTIICANSLVNDQQLDMANTDIEDLYEIMPMSEIHQRDFKFDVIIGNPPYLNKEDIINSMPEAEIEVYDKEYKTAYKQYDKYFLFLEKVSNSLKEDGICVLLVPNKFFNIGSAIKLRELFEEKQNIFKIFDFGSKQLFKGVINYVCALKLRKDNGPKFTYAKVNSSNEIYDNKHGLEYDITELDTSHWFLTDNEALKEQFEYAKTNFPCIEEEIIPANGIQTSKNLVYKIDKKDIVFEDDDLINFRKKGEEYTLEKSILRNYYLPSTRTGANKSYQNLKATNYVIFPYIDGKIIPSESMEKDYPNTWEYLNVFKDDLLPKSMGGKRDVRGGESTFEWYQFGRSQALKEVDQDKILVGVLSREPNFNIDRENMAYSSGGTAGYVGLYLKEGSKYNLEFIQAWLSHRFTDEIFKTIGSDFEGGFYTHGTGTYKDIPLVPIDFDNKVEKAMFDEVTELVRSIRQDNIDIEGEQNNKKKDLLLRRKETKVNSINEIIDKLIDMKVKDER